MSETETSENEESDIEECVSVAYKNFMADSIVAEPESGENSVLSLSTSAPFSSQDGTSPKSSRVADINWFVNTQLTVFYMDCYDVMTEIICSEILKQHMHNCPGVGN